MTDAKQPCTVTGEAIAQRRQVTPDATPELVWLRADPEVHVTDELVSIKQLRAKYRPTEWCNERQAWHAVLLGT